MSESSQRDQHQPDCTPYWPNDERTVLRKPEGWRPTPFLDTVEVEVEVEVEGRGTMTVT